MTRTIRAEYTANLPAATLFVFYSADVARAEFARAEAMGLNPTALETPKYGNASFEIAR